MIRVRPLIEKEKTRAGELCIKIDNDERRIMCISGTESMQSEGLGQSNSFSFDKVFGMRSTQQEVYDGAARSIIDSVLEGFNGTIFAYG